MLGTILRRLGRQRPAHLRLRRSLRQNRKQTRQTLPHRPGASRQLLLHASRRSGRRTSIQQLRHLPCAVHTLRPPKPERSGAGLQEFFFNMNVPTRVGFQTPFTNLTLDLTVPDFMKNEAVLFNGKVTEDTYGDMTKEMEMFNIAFAEVMSQGDSKGRVFTFPIPTYNITKDFDWDSAVSQKIFEVTAKYGVPYFSQLRQQRHETRRRPKHVLPTANRQPRTAQTRRRLLRRKPANRQHRRRHPEHAENRLPIQRRGRILRATWKHQWK